MRGTIVQTIALENKRGFTLIELVIVIVLIGILAATALPKFANLTTQARTAANQGVAGGLGAAVSIAHAAWVAQGATGTVINSPNSELHNVSVNANGWPDGGAGVANPAGAQCLVVWNAILNNPPTLVVGTSCATSGCYFVPSGAAATCVFTQGASAGTTITYSTTAGTVVAAP